MLHYLKKAWPFWETYPESNSHHSSDVAFVRLWSNYYRTIHLYHPFCISILIAIIPSYHIIVYIYIPISIFYIIHISPEVTLAHMISVWYTYIIYLCVYYIYIYIYYTYLEDLAPEPLASQESSTSDELRAQRKANSSSLWRKSWRHREKLGKCATKFWGLSMQFKHGDFFLGFSMGKCCWGHGNSWFMAKMDGLWL